MRLRLRDYQSKYLVKRTAKGFRKFSPIYLAPESLFDLDIWLQLFKDSKHNMIDIDFFKKIKKHYKSLTLFVSG